MNIRMTLTLALMSASALHTHAQVKTNTSTTKTEKQMNTIIKSSQPVQDFFSSFAKGDFQGILNTFHDSCSIAAVREGERVSKQIYGSYKGKEGLKEFLTNMGNTFDTKTFTVEHIIGEGDVAFANGSFTHNIKSTGKAFSSDWSLMCTIKDGKILGFHFYEDSASFLAASSN